MLETIEKLRKGFWNEDVWTPPNATWKMYETNGYRHFNDLYYSAYTAVILIIIRIIFNRYVYTHTHTQEKNWLFSFISIIICT